VLLRSDSLDPRAAPNNVLQKFADREAPTACQFTRAILLLCEPTPSKLNGQMNRMHCRTRSATRREHALHFGARSATRAEHRSSHLQLNGAGVRIIFILHKATTIPVAIPTVNFHSIRKNVMIIIGAYADGLETYEPKVSPIAELANFLKQAFPEEVGAHLLPFYPHSGDAGFAINDWFSIRPDLGTWIDLRRLAASRRLVVDGVYNHVGMGHKWVQSFMESPWALADLLHAYPKTDAITGPMSPRGQHALTPYIIRESEWLLWHTFSNAAVDIRLTDALVMQEIKDHLRLLHQNGVWGVRLDAVAYYAKWPGSEIRHNPGCHEIADSIAELIEEYGMRVLAQLDCDAHGSRYFTEQRQTHYVTNDFTYSALLALAIITGDPMPLARHLRVTASPQHTLLRGPRTHDGLLLRSGLLRKEDRDRLLETITRYGIQIRVTGGEPYELNCSAPFLYSTGGRRAMLPEIIEMAVAVTGMTSGWSYFYLPFLLGHIPEEQSPQRAEDDPRELNRRPIRESEWRHYLTSSKRHRMCELMRTLTLVQEDPTAPPTPGASDTLLLGNHLLSLVNPRGNYNLLANFSSEKAAIIPRSHRGSLVWSSRLDGQELAPLGYGIWHTG
jgi:hypothetical protein